jgi:uncharacterized protein (DUF58 family)
VGAVLWSPTLTQEGAHEARPPRRRPVLTRTGTTLLAGAALLAAAGVLLGYGELVVVAVAGLVLVAISALVPRFASPLTVERHVGRRLVQRGQDVHVHLAIESERRTPGLRLYDRLGEHEVGVDVPPLRAGGVASVSYRIATERRGLHVVGPLVEERSDPLGSLTRSIPHELTSQVWVHPVVHQLASSLPRSGRSTGRIQANTIAQDPTEDFRGLREYIPGDDARRIHWASTARTGQLVVREQTESRRQTRLVVLETLTEAASRDEFEEAVEIAASLALLALDEGVMVTPRTRSRATPGLARPVSRREQLLELFTIVERSRAGDTLPLSSVLAHTGEVERVYFVTGSRSPAVGELLARERLRHHLNIIRVGSQPATAPRTTSTVFDVRSAAEFALRWSGR